MTQSKSSIKNSKLFYMYVGTSPVGGSNPQKFIWDDTQGCANGGEGLKLNIFYITQEYS